MTPGVSYVVCATHRSGSGVLCEALWSTGLAGRPGEHFHPDRYGATPAAARGHAREVLRERATPNGVFGTKLMPGYLHALAGRLGAEPEWAARSAPELLRALLPEPRFVWLRRRDEVRQAVSLWKAEATSVYRRGAGEPVPAAPAYDFAAIHDGVRRVRAWNAAWEVFFREAGGADVTLFYEDDVEAAGCEAAVRRVLACLGVEAPEELTVATALHRKMGGEDTERAVLRYRREAAEAGRVPVGSG